MLTKLLAADWIPQNYKDWFLILGVSGMRVNQMERLSFANCELVGTGDDAFWSFTTRANHKGKGGNVGGRNGAQTQNYVCPKKFTAALTAALSRLLAQKPAGDASPLVGGGFRRYRALKLIKLAAETFKWAVELDWVIHGFRHGAAVEAFMETHPAETDMQKLLHVRSCTGHTSLEMLMHYSRSNEDRLLCVRAQQIIGDQRSRGFPIARTLLLEGRTLKVAGRVRLINVNAPQIRLAYKEHNLNLQKEQTRKLSAKKEVKVKKAAGKKAATEQKTKAPNVKAVAKVKAPV